MPKFKDTTGHVWELRFNVTLAREILNACEINLLTLDGKGKAFARMDTDRDLLARVLYLTLKPEISEAEFGERLSGEVFNEASEALRGAVTAFQEVPKYTLGSPDAKGPQEPTVRKAVPVEGGLMGTRPDGNSFSTVPGGYFGGAIQR
jgi:hypothetical protein